MRKRSNKNNGNIGGQKICFSIFIILFISSIIFYWLSPDVLSGKPFLSLMQLYSTITTALLFLMTFFSNKSNLEQTQKQISMIEKKDKTELYLSHYNYNTKLSSSFTKDITPFDFNGSMTLSVDSPNALYRKLYPRNSLRDGIADFSPNVVREDTIELLLSIYSGFFTGVLEPMDKSTKKNQPIGVLPLEFEEDNFIKIGCRPTVNIQRLFLELKIFLNTRGINITAVGMNGSKVEDYGSYIVNSSQLPQELISIFVYWLDLNRLLSSDLSDNDIKHMAKSFSAFSISVTSILFPIVVSSSANP